MEFLVTTEIKTRPTQHILEDFTDASGFPAVRKWKIIGTNRFWLLGIDIQNGSTTRIIFPADFDNYYVN